MTSAQPKVGMSDCTNAQQQALRTKASAPATKPSSPSKHHSGPVDELDRRPSPPSQSVEEDLPPPEWVLVNGESLTDEDHNTVKRIIWRGRRLIVKYGWLVRQQEADIMRFVRTKTTVPVPEVFAVKVHQKRVFIYMEYIEGSTLSDCDASIRRAVAPQILACITELRQLRLPRDGQIGDFPTSTHRNLKRAVLGVAPSASRARTPTLLDTAAFQRWLISEVTTRSRVLPSAEMREPLLPHILSLDASAPIVFTHGDLHSGNILVRDGQVVGIIDWEIAGWYPEWVEAEIVGHYRDTQRDEQVAELAAALGIAEEEKAWKSPYLWIYVIRMG